MAIISGRSSRSVDIRAADLGISPVYQGVPDKSVAFQAILASVSGLYEDGLFITGATRGSFDDSKSK